MLLYHFLLEVCHTGDERIFNAFHIAYRLLLVILLTRDHLSPHLDHLFWIMASEFKTVLKYEVGNIAIDEVLKVISHVLLIKILLK